ncbi:MAG TPA: Type 1 glutamine amidotransferase-like domain-containing protein [Candidatus Saccharimonadales bacterium]|nr:Type 1 glutamine amidotransferase-like domain-containing protein [Candidatus Saccharimonadales bacterium]
MKLLLTSAGVTNNSIASALESLAGKARGALRIGFVPTAVYPEAGNKDWFLAQLANLSRHGFGWVDIIEPTAPEVIWRDRLAAVDVVYVSGGNTFYLLAQMQQVDFGGWLRQGLANKVYVGSSAGSLILTPSIAVVEHLQADRNLHDTTDLTGLGLVDFEFMPHAPDDFSFEQIAQYMHTAKHPLYAVDNQTAVQVVDGQVSVISEGQWKLFEPGAGAP